MTTQSTPQGSKGFYDSADLRMLEEITDEVLAALVRAEDYPLETGVTEVLRLRIAAVVFEFANSGELDRDVLKHRVLARFYTPQVSRQPRAS